MASKKLDLNFSNKTTPEIARFIQLSKETGNSISGMMSCALEYYVQTGSNIKLGSVCTETVKKEDKKYRIAIVVSPKVEEWTNNLKSNKYGLISLWVRQILKDSLEVVESEDKEHCRDYTEVVLELDRLNGKIIKQEAPVTQIVEVVQRTEPINQNINISVQKEEEKIITSTPSIPSVNNPVKEVEKQVVETLEVINPPTKQKKAKKERSLMDKLMPPMDW